jgi:ribonucleotide monophosphatase NagD (HAD superfamily)
MLYHATKRRPIFIGKPEPTMVLLAMEKTGFTPQETALIGDRLYTDIACGVNAGVNSVFVLSGEGTITDLEKSDVKPDYVYENIKAFYDDIRRPKTN